MTKFTPVGFTLALDRELGESGIKVGGICPGGVKTEFAIGKSRTESRVAESGMPDPEDVWCGAPGLAHGPQNCVLLRCRCARWRKRLLERRGIL